MKAAHSIKTEISKASPGFARIRENVPDTVSFSLAVFSGGRYIE
jgi:hypothetical protein